jgi:hypothetical protein
VGASCRVAAWAPRVASLGLSVCGRRVVALSRGVASCGCVGAYDSIVAWLRRCVVAPSRRCVVGVLSARRVAAWARPIPAWARGCVGVLRRTVVASLCQCRCIDVASHHRVVASRRVALDVAGTYCVGASRRVVCVGALRCVALRCGGVWARCGVASQRLRKRVASHWCDGVSRRCVGASRRVAASSHRCVGALRRGVASSLGASRPCLVASVRGRIS